MDSLAERVARSILRRELLSREERILVAVSGGVDSMVLLTVLHQLATARNWRLTVAHFNHRLRGRASDADERLVRMQAKRLGLPFVSGAGDVRAEAKRRGLSLEMAARELRHRFLVATAHRRRIHTIVLAHHADDQVELLLLRLLRGATADGLGGMRWSSPAPFAADIRLVRPLLDMSKNELRAFAERTAVVFREDASNARRDHLRNRIRHDLLPRLERNYQPGLRAVLLRLAESLAEDADFIATQAAKWRRKPGRTGFGGLPRAVQRRVLVEELIGAGLAPDFELVERLRQSGQRASAPGGRLVSRDRCGRIRVSTPLSADFLPDRRSVMLVGRAGEVSFGGMKLSWHLGKLDARPGVVTRKSGIEQFDADKIGSRIAVRHWRAGDRFQPIGMSRSVKLQDLFVNLKVPADERRRRVVAEAESGTIFWVEGVRISETFKLDTGTRRRLKWCWRRP